MKRLFIGAIIIKLIASVLICLSNFEVIQLSNNDLLNLQNLALIASCVVYFAMIYYSKPFEDIKNLRRALYTYFGLLIVIKLSSYIFEPNSWFSVTCSMFATLTLIVFIYYCFRIKSHQISTNFKLIGLLEIVTFIMVLLTPLITVRSEHSELLRFMPLYNNIPAIGILLLILNQNESKVSL